MLSPDPGVTSIDTFFGILGYAVPVNCSYASAHTGPVREVCLSSCISTCKPMAGNVRWSVTNVASNGSKHYWWTAMSQLTVQKQHIKMVHEPVRRTTRMRAFLLA